MTLRARLTTAFLAMVLGPVLLGALFVGVTVTKVNHDRVTERLDLAANAVHTSVGALCGQLRTAAEAIAATPAEQRMVLAGQFVSRRLASGVHVEQNLGSETTAEAPPPPWADCSGAVDATADGADAGAVTGYEALAAKVALPEGGGSVQVAVTIDNDLVTRLSEAAGAETSLLAWDSTATAAERVPPVHSTLTGDSGLAVSTVAMGILDGQTATANDGRLVRRLGPSAGQPLPLAVSLPAGTSVATYLLLTAVVLVTAFAAIFVAWWLARTSTSPLVGLAAAADRVAAGDLQTRVPARGDDELGRLAHAFNHMTKELHTYVAALTASRDQLRGHLGVLGDTLSSTHDLDRILEVILQTARHATGASAGLVLLADPASPEGDLVGKCSEGLDFDVRQLQVRLGQGLLGSVAATGVPRLGRIERDGPRLDAAEPECRTYVVVPFSAPAIGEVSHGPALPAARGVLALYDRLGRDEFDESDLVTLRTFAGQAAVAVDNVRVHEEAQRLSITDSLTGLLNYRSLRETLRRESDRAGRFGRKLCVLALDLDRFKEINDGFGHAAGDAVLAECAQRIRYEIREVDLAFRHGGEEFVVLLPETDEVGGIAVAERLCEAIRRDPVCVTGRADGAQLNIPVTVSIGVAVLPDHGQGGNAVLQAADDALYVAKAAGRDTFRVADIAQLALSSRVGGASSSPQAPRQGRGR